MSAAPIPQGFKRFDAVYGDSLTWRDDGEFMRYDDHAAALAASEARAAELRAELEQSEARCMAMFADVAMLGVAEQSLAEAIGLLRQARGWINTSAITTQPSEIIAAIDALLPKGEGATS